jgi:hypothetical protein
MRVHPIDLSRSRTLSRAIAFAAQGVALKHPWHSWSGVRGGDGAVVIAMRSTDVQVDGSGSRCLLWAPAIGPDAEFEWTSHQERLEHCALATRRGAAEGLVSYGRENVFNPDEVLAVRVVKVGTQYWAKWGAVTRTRRSRRFRMPGTRSADARLAA